MLFLYYKNLKEIFLTYKSYKLKNLPLKKSGQLVKIQQQIDRQIDRKIERESKRERERARESEKQRESARESERDKIEKEKVVCPNYYTREVHEIITQYIMTQK